MFLCFSNISMFLTQPHPTRPSLNQLRLLWLSRSRRRREKSPGRKCPDSRQFLCLPGLKYFQVFEIFSSFRNIFRSPKKSFSRQESVAVPDPEDEEVYNGLDASQSLIIHGNQTWFIRIIIKETDLSYSGIETDWIEEEMSDDDDFRKDVIEQKIKKVLEEIGFTKKIAYKVEILINIED